MQAVCIPPTASISLAGRFFCANSEMAREINVNAEDRLDLQDAADAAPDACALALLEAAYDERLGQIGGRALMLEPVVQIATTHGFTGTVDEASRLLQASGWRVEIGHDGQLVAWRVG